MEGGIPRFVVLRVRDDGAVGRPVGGGAPTGAGEAGVMVTGSCCDPMELWSGRICPVRMTIPRLQPDYARFLDLGRMLPHRVASADRVRVRPTMPDEVRCDARPERPSSGPDGRL